MKYFVKSLCAAALVTATSVLAEPASFNTPYDALEAMISGLKASDPTALGKVFGEEAADYLSDGDPVEDDLNRRALIALYGEGYRLVPQEDGSVMIALGSDGWLFPVPIAKSGDTGWSFDNEAGREEVLAREIGRNELDVIELLEAYVAIQAEFRQSDQDGDGVMEFARQIISTSAQKRDGLFWAAEDTPLGELFARASTLGYNDGVTDQPPEPYSGYYFRLLTEQGNAAPGGKMDYLVNGNMVGGHALLAVPSEFGETGIHSFMVAENGIILEAILGEDTLDKAATITSYDPTKEWTPVEQE